MSFARFANGRRVPEKDVPLLDVASLRAAVVAACHDGEARIAAFFGRRLESGVRLHVVLAFDYEGHLATAAADLPAGNLRYRALTIDLPEAHAFERELHDELGVVPDGHPWLKPLRSEAAHPFFAVEGSEVHEVAVGPVHAGIIEPGHFRFQCHGEEVIHLEIQLGYQRRGAEAILERPGTTPARAALVAETIAGDSSIAHGLAHATALEGLAGIEAPPRAQVLRAVALELERLANHVGDLAGLSTDIGFLPGTSHLGALRGEFLNLGQELGGNRYGRSFVRPGGVVFDLDDARLAAIRARVARAGPTFTELAELFFGAPSVLSRLYGTGPVGREDAEDLGLVGVAARASGCDRDVRRDHPTGAWRFAHVPVALGESGDVYARALVRRLEGERSLDYLEGALARLPAGAVRSPAGKLEPSSLCVALVEGWRGETVHAVLTDPRGAVARYKVVDPSFHDWFGLALALRGQQISDFPLCNKSFNLSYAGHDL